MKFMNLTRICTSWMSPDENLKPRNDDVDAGVGADVDFEDREGGEDAEVVVELLC